MKYSRPGEIRGFFICRSFAGHLPGQGQVAVFIVPHGHVHELGGDVKIFGEFPGLGDAAGDRLLQLVLRDEFLYCPFIGAVLNKPPKKIDLAMVRINERRGEVCIMQ